MVDLDSIKMYLKIDYDEEDEYLESLILVSEIYIDACVGEGYRLNEKGIKLAGLLQKKLINDMYSNRGSEIPNNTKKDRVVTTILDKLSGFSDEVI